MDVYLKLKMQKTSLINVCSDVFHSVYQQIQKGC